MLPSLLRPRSYVPAALAVAATVAVAALAAWADTADYVTPVKPFAQRVKAALMTDDRLDASGIAVDCAAPGRLRLHGRVNSDEEKELAESIARSFSGVQALESELVVMPPIEGWYPV